MKKKLSLFLLMVTISIEAMGHGLILPLLPTLLASSTSPFHLSPSYFYLYYSLSVALWPLGIFFGTSYLSTLSDILGRKKILLICLTGNALFCALTALTIDFRLLLLFFLLRFFSGFVCGSYDIAQAAAADLSEKEERGKVMGFISFAYSVGLIIGPLITSFCGSFVFSSFATPFWIAAGISFLNALFLYLFFSETYQFQTNCHFSLKDLLLSFLFVFQDLRVRTLGFIFLIFCSGWSLQFQFHSLFLTKMFNFSPAYVAFFFLVIACSYAIIFLIQSYVFKRFSLVNLFIIANVINGFSLFLATILPASWQWFLGSIISMGIMVAYTSLLALISQAVSSTERGKIMGNLGALGSLSTLFTAGCIGTLSYISLLLPFCVAAIAFLVSGFWLKSYFTDERSVENI